MHMLVLKKVLVICDMIKGNESDVGNIDFELLEQFTIRCNGYFSRGF